VSIPAAIEPLVSLAPEAAGGYERVLGAIESEGALSIAHKALLVAIGSAVRGDSELARRELGRGRSAGLSDAEIVTAAAAVLLSRGESACGRVLGAAGPLALDDPPSASPDLDAAQYFLGYNRVEVLPPRLAILAERAPAVFEGYFRMHHAVLAGEPELALLAELVLCSLNTAELRGDFVAIHAIGARRAGASDEQLLEAILCAMPVAGVAAWTVGATALFPDA
jgi:alkylhydroperoxidase/carboxymuconolactone decarboxylase family protein YurZ